MANWQRPQQWLDKPKDLTSMQLVELFKQAQTESEKLVIILWAFEQFSGERWLLKRNKAGVLRGVRNVCNSRPDRAPLGYELLLTDDSLNAGREIGQGQWCFQLVSQHDPVKEMQKRQEVPNHWAVWEADGNFVFQPL